LYNDLLSIHRPFNHEKIYYVFHWLKFRRAPKIVLNNIIPIQEGCSREPDFWNSNSSQQYNVCWGFPSRWRCNKLPSWVGKLVASRCSREKQNGFERGFVAEAATVAAIAQYYHKWYFFLFFFVFRFTRRISRHFDFPPTNQGCGRVIIIK